MFRKLRMDDKEVYLSMVEKFYNSDVVFSPVPKEVNEATFNEIMRDDTYLECYVFEEDNKVCGYALLSKMFSPEAGGLAITYEELYLEEESRNKGYMSEFFKYVNENYDYKRLRLEVEDYNEGAKRLYERNGFMELPYIQMVVDKWRKENEK